MNVDIYYAPANRKIEHISMTVLEGTSLDKVLPPHLANRVAAHELTAAVWGRAVSLHYPLQAGDRVELVRDLRVDPMTARRERFNQQGIKKAGLFKTKRQGAKAGY